MWDHDGRRAYIGKATNFRRRTNDEAELIKSQNWRRWTAEPVPWWQPSFVLERRRIQQHKPYQNRNQGTEKLRLRVWLTPWRY